MFTKLQKVTVSFIIWLSVHSLVLMKQFGSHWTDFHEIYFIHFCKMCREHSVLLKSDKKSRYFTQNLCTDRSCFMPGICSWKMSHKANAKFPFKTVCSLMGFTTSASVMCDCTTSGHMDLYSIFYIYRIFMIFRKWDGGHGLDWSGSG